MVRHLAELISPDGKVSPLCAKKPRAINLNVATWTNRKSAVTCNKCLASLPKDDSYYLKVGS